jgi:hypothetical protein
MLLLQLSLLSSLHVKLFLALLPAKLLMLLTVDTFVLSGASKES